MTASANGSLEATGVFSFSRRATLSKTDLSFETFPLPRIASA
jgi:hypothetical protein